MYPYLTIVIVILYPIYSYFILFFFYFLSDCFFWQGVVYLFLTQSYTLIAIIAPINTWLPKELILSTIQDIIWTIPGLATYFHFSFRFFKKGSCQLLVKVCARSTGLTA